MWDYICCGPGSLRLRPDPTYRFVHQVRGSTVGWHLDKSTDVTPPVATILGAVEVPPTGGDTLWVNAASVYEALSPQLKERIESMYVTHGIGLPRNPQWPDGALIAHRAVQTHPETGERYLYINFAPWIKPQFVGLHPDESDALVDELWQEYMRPEHQGHFAWSPGTVVMWDNRVLLHTGTEDYGDSPRHLQRICLSSLHPLP